MKKFGNGKIQATGACLLLALVLGACQAPWQVLVAPKESGKQATQTAAVQGGKLSEEEWGYQAENENPPFEATVVIRALQTDKHQVVAHVQDSSAGVFISKDLYFTWKDELGAWDQLQVGTKAQMHFSSYYVQPDEIRMPSPHVDVDQVKDFSIASTSASHTAG